MPTTLRAIRPRGIDAAASIESVVGSEFIAADCEQVPYLKLNLGYVMASFFKNRCRKPRFIKFSGGIQVHRSLLHRLLYDQAVRENDRKGFSPTFRRMNQAGANPRPVNVSKIEQNVPPMIGILIEERLRMLPFGASNTSIEREVFWMCGLDCRDWR